MYQLKSAPFYRRTFHGSVELFKACWRQYRTLDTDPPTCDTDVIDSLDQLAAEKVNTPGRFYIYG